MRTVAVVLAGGSGRRFGAVGPKQLRVLAGRNLIAHCAHAFSAAPMIDQLLVVAAPEIAAQVRQDIAGYGKIAAVIEGGVARTDSTRQAINWLSAPERGGQAGQECNVLFHDAARPLVDQRTIADCVSALGQWRAVSVVVPSADTIVEIADGKIQRVLPRDSLARCQTPQGFRLSVIRRAYQLADADPAFADTPATDDCGVVLRYLPDVPVGVVQGSERNLKITYPADLLLAEALLGAGPEAG
jgi:2-C-methyl-D-erythritol 4-phosphate cytidylyltransferase